MIKGKSPEEIRKTFNITNDFTPEEEEQIRRENEWAEDRWSYFGEIIFWIWWMKIGSISIFPSNSFSLCITYGVLFVLTSSFFCGHWWDDWYWHGVIGFLLLTVIRPWHGVLVHHWFLRGSRLLDIIMTWLSRVDGLAKQNSEILHPHLLDSLWYCLLFLVASNFPSLTLLCFALL